MATDSSILAWGTPWTEEPHGLVHEVAKELDMAQQLNNNLLDYVGEGPKSNGCWCAYKEKAI